MQLTRPFTIEEINQQVDRILDFPAFAKSPTLSKFLRFIVSETVYERDECLKEYSIAINVLNRPVNFNPHDDAVVRIHAGRLRRAINDYYYTQGINDPVIIRIPKGGYIPQFDIKVINDSEIVKSPDNPKTDLNPVLAIFPFKTIPHNQEINEFATILSEQLSSELSKFQDISVIGYFTKETMEKIEYNILEAGKSINANYILTGNIQQNNHHIRIRANLLSTRTGEIIMTRSFEKEVQLSNLFEIQDEVVENIVSAIGGYYGIIFLKMAKAFAITILGNPEIRDSIYKYYQYQRYFSIENYNNALYALQQAVSKYPLHAITWCMLGELYLEGYSLKIKTIHNVLEESHHCIIQSLKIEPNCQYGWHAMALYHLLNKEKEACKEAVDKCININPNNSAMTASAAAVAISAGYFEEGFTVMEKAVKLNAYYPWRVNGGFCLYYLYKKEYTLALEWVEKMNAPETFWDSLLKAVCFYYLDNKKEGEKYLSILLEQQPEIPSQLHQILSFTILSEELITIITQGLYKIGLKEHVIRQAGQYKLEHA